MLRSFLQLLLLLLPAAGFAQVKLDTISLWNGELKMLAPKKFKPMPRSVFKSKYPRDSFPEKIISDAYNEVDLLFNTALSTPQNTEPGQLLKFAIKRVRNKFDSVVFLADGLDTVNGKEVCYLKFYSKGGDYYIYNFYLYIFYEERIRCVGFNCFVFLQDKWEPIANQIMSSIVIR